MAVFGGGQASEGQQRLTLSSREQEVSGLRVALAFGGVESGADGQGQVKRQWELLAVRCKAMR